MPRRYLTNNPGAQCVPVIPETQELDIWDYVKLRLSRAKAQDPISKRVKKAKGLGAWLEW